MNKKLKKSIGTLTFTVVLTFVCTGLIASVNALAKSRIDLNKTLFLKRAVRQAAGLAPLGTDALTRWYDSDVTPITGTDGMPAHFEVLVDDRRCIVLPQAGAGLWGTIHALVGFAPDRTTFLGFAVQAHSETPGLGARIEEPWFHSQFKGKSGPITTLLPEKSGAPGSAQMDAITGATVTSKAVQSILNESLATLQNIDPAHP